MLSIMGAPSIAAAQLEAGARYLADADFERAERAYGRALDQTTLTLEQLVSIYEGRAMARWALGDQDAARTDLAALASIDPGHRLPREAPPTLTSAYESLGAQAIAVTVEWTDAPGLAHAHVQIDHDGAGVVRSLRLHARRAGEPWAIESGTDLDVARDAAQTVELWVEALGPGDAVVARAGTSLAPLSRGPAAELGHSLTRATPASDTTPIWIGVGVAAGVVVIALIIGIAVGVSESQGFQPAAPVVVGF